MNGNWECASDTNQSTCVPEKTFSLAIPFSIVTQIPITSVDGELPVPTSAQIASAASASLKSVQKSESKATSKPALESSQPTVPSSLTTTIAIPSSVTTGSVETQNTTFHNNKTANGRSQRTSLAAGLGVPLAILTIICLTLLTLSWRHQRARFSLRKKTQESKADRTSWPQPASIPSPVEADGIQEWEMPVDRETPAEIHGRRVH